MSDAALPSVFGRSVRRIHCVGAGGMGVAPLAIYLSRLGFTVSGEDDAMMPEVRELLERAGVRIGPIDADCELMVHSSAIAPAHPTFAAARARRLSCVRRGEMLAEIVSGKKFVAVCGSHGKTTTTAMLITALRGAGFPAGYVLGGLFADGSPPADVGTNEWVVAEVDESDGTIERFTPEITVAVNLDWDHPDHYRDRAELERTFQALFARTRGLVLFNAECAVSRRSATELAAMAAHRIEAEITGPEFASFGTAGDFSGQIVREDGVRMVLQLDGRFARRETVVQVRGAFNAANATAALAAAQWMGARVGGDVLANYPGVRRRQTVLHEDAFTVIEDYAHHPAEIRALLGSLRERLRHGQRAADQRGAVSRLIVVFQPHRFSRTAQFKVDFAQALGAADRLYLLDVYGAGEAPMVGGTTADVAAAVGRQNPLLPVHYQPSPDRRWFDALDREVRPGDLLAFVGAGDIDRKARAWLERRTRKPRSAGDWDAALTKLQSVVSAETNLRRDELLGPKTTMRVGGPARIYAEPASVADLQALLRTAAAEHVEVFMLGRGSNLLVPDEGVEGLVISLAHEAWAEFEVRPDGRIRVGAGLRLKNLCGLAAKAGLSGFEFLEGIPGNVGGALRMNAGAMGGWMFDVVDELQLMTMEGEVKTLPRSALKVTYRHCPELDHAIALGALLRRPAYANAEAVNQQIAAYRKKRQETQPREPSAGCIFKNPPGTSAGRLIDESGLKGTRVGDAEVSPIHANFIINRGHATATEVLALVRRIRARVKEVKGIDLEPEVLLYGKSWEDVL